MKKEQIGTGKTIEEAIQAACLALNIDRDTDELDIEVLTAPSKGFMGLRSTDAKVRVSIEQNDYDAETFLAKVMDLMGVQCEIISKKDSELLSIELCGSNMGTVIGRRGETLDALQYITSLVINKGKQDYIKVSIDIENYRRKREETLEELAKKLAGKAIKFRHNVTLEPMNAYERRIIHATLQQHQDISTFSTGSEPNRKVVISYSPGGNNSPIQ